MISLPLVFSNLYTYIHTCNAVLRSLASPEVMLRFFFRPLFCPARIFETTLGNTVSFGTFFLFISFILRPNTAL